MAAITRMTAIGALAVTVLLAPPAHAAPEQPCDETFGNSVDAYLKRHPDIKKNLEKHGQQEDPGSPNPVLSYLERHPDVRQALITLSQQCV